MLLNVKLNSSIISYFVAEGSIFDVGSSPSRDDDEKNAGDMVKDEFEIGKDGDEGRRNSTDTAEETDFNFEGMRNGFNSGLTVRP